MALWSHMKNTPKTLKQAKDQLERFMGETVLTFSVKQYPGEEWVAQCNEIDGIVTGGTGYDLDQMERLIRDAILSAAGIPNKFADKILKRIWNPRPPLVSKSSNVGEIISPYQSTYATVGSV